MALSRLYHPNFPKDFIFGCVSTNISNVIYQNLCMFWPFIRAATATNCCPIYHQNNGEERAQPQRLFGDCPNNFGEGNEEEKVRNGVPRRLEMLMEILPTYHRYLTFLFRWSVKRLVPTPISSSTTIICAILSGGRAHSRAGLPYVRWTRLACALEMYVRALDLFCPRLILWNESIQFFCRRLSRQRP